MRLLEISQYTLTSIYVKDKLYYVIAISGISQADLFVGSFSLLFSNGFVGIRKVQKDLL